VAPLHPTFTALVAHQGLFFQRGTYPHQGTVRVDVVDVAPLGFASFSPRASHLPVCRSGNRIPSDAASACAQTARWGPNDGNQFPLGRAQGNVAVTRIPVLQKTSTYENSTARSILLHSANILEKRRQRPEALQSCQLPRFSGLHKLEAKPFR
jgi:hypothetical protein